MAMNSADKRIYNKRMSNGTDVMIIGGGVIGLSAAYRLAERGVRVSVLDRGNLGREASWAGAGIIPPGNPAGARAPYDQLRAESSSLFPDLAATLFEQTGIDIGYRRCGGLEYSSDEPIDTSVWTEEGVLWERCPSDTVRRMEPHLANGLGPAFHLPDMAQVRNPWYLQALATASQALGACLLPGCPLFSVRQLGRRITSVETGNGNMVAAQYLICAGAWTDTLLAPIGCRVGVTPIRGQIALLRTRSPLLRNIVLQGKRYMVPRPDGRVLVGSTEENAGFDKTTTATAIAELIRFAAERVPALSEAAVERCWAGLRPGSPDGLPSIGRVAGFDNLWVAAGHFRAGLQLSAATGVVLAQALTGNVPRVSLDAFRPDRPTAPPIRPAFRS
jgi:glycine oxidase